MNTTITQTRRQFLAGLGTVAIGIGAGCTGAAQTAETDESSNPDSNPSSSSTSGSDSTQNADNGRRQQMPIEIEDLRFIQGEYGNLSLAGTATNLTDSTLKYVQITVEFLDATDAQIGTSMANTNNLAPGQRWKWEAMYYGMDTSEVASGGITDIDAY